MARLFLKPSALEAEKPDGPILSIPAPDYDGKALPAKGGWVESSSYWSRRLLDGDVVDDTDAELKREAEDDARAAKAAKGATPKKDA